MTFDYEEEIKHLKSEFAEEVEELYTIISE